MTQTFGDRSTFSVEVGEPVSAGLRTVDYWAGGKWLTCDDNAAFVPATFPQMRGAAERVRRRDVPPCPWPGLPPRKVYRRLDRGLADFRWRFHFLGGNEITDNVSCCAYLDGADLVLTFEFWRPTHHVPEEIGKVFVARLPADDFVAVFQAAADFLDAGWVRPPR